MLFYNGERRRQTMRDSSLWEKTEGCGRGGTWGDGVTG